MGKLLTIVIAGVGAYYVWRSRQVTRCPACDRQIRAEARACRHCGEAVQEGDVMEAEIVRD